MIGKKINQLATELAPVSTDLTIIGDPISGVSKKITLAQLGAIFSGAVSFYNDFASFPVTGDINVIYCAKDTQKLYLWAASAYVEVFPSQALLDTYQLRSEKGNANGYASLDSLGKVPISQLPSSIMEYKGTWNAATNTPTLANGTGDTGDVYICNVAGTVNFGAGPITFAVGDYTIYSGSIWQRSSGAVGTVTSVAASITGDSITISNSPITTSGTLAFAFGGNSTQYINGAGNLVTFPGIINEAQNLITEVYNKTGATLTKGTIVYINGGQGNLPAVTKALATGDSTSAQTYGIVRNDITNNNNGYVVVAGRISDLDTQAYTEGTQLYLSPTTAGTFTSTKPYAPNHLVYVGIVVRAHPTQGVVEVKIQNGYELDELHNVAAQTPSNNDGLFWEASTSLWKNKSIATILGYTPVSGTGVSGQVTYFNGTTSVTGNNNFFWDAANNRLGIGTTTPQRSIEIYNATADSHLRLSGSAPSVSMGEAVTGSIYQAKFALITSNGQFVTGGVAGDFLILSQTGATIFATNSTEKMRVSASGNLSVGNTNNTYKLDVSGTGRFTGQLRLESTITDGTNTYTLPSSTGTLALTSQIPSLTGYITGSGTANYIAKFAGLGSTITNSLIYDNGTNVGINTTSPSAKLDVTDTSAGSIVNNITVQNASNTSGTEAGLFFAPTTATGNIRGARITGIQEDGNNAIGLKFYTGLGATISEKMRITSGGLVGIGTTSPATLLQVKGNGSNMISVQYAADGGAAGYGFYNSAGTELWSIGGGRFVSQDALEISRQGSLKFLINSSGNVGIGTTSPTLAKFVVDASNQSYTMAAVGNDQSSARIRIKNTGSGGGDYAWIAGENNVGNDGFTLYDITNNATRLKIGSSGGASFYSTVQSTRFFNTFVNSSANSRNSFQSYNLNEASLTVGWIAADYGDLGTTSDRVVMGSGYGNKAILGGHNGTLTAWANLLINPGGGNVGIGTTSPSYALDVYRDTSTASYIVGRNGSGVQTAIGVAGDNGSLLGTLSNHNLRIVTNGAVVATITTAGNVGIGTTSPSEKLDVIGGAVAAGNGTIRTGITYSSLGLIGTFTNHDLGVITNGTERMRITSGGSLLVSTTTSTASVFKLQVGDGTTDTRSFFNPSNAFAIGIANGGSSAWYIGVNAQTAANGLQFYSNELGGVTMTIKTTGVINIQNVPSSSAGLSSGDIYKTVAGVLMIV